MVIVSEAGDKSNNVKDESIELQAQLANKDSSEAQNYKEWNMKEMEIWLRELENGRYQKYIQKLIGHATIANILPSDILDLTDVKLEVFGIDNIEDRLGLRYQFQKLKALDVGENTVYN